MPATWCCCWRWLSNVKNYDDLSVDYVTACSNNVAAAAAMGFAALRQAQTNDYQTLFKRVVLDLGTDSRTNMDTGYRKKQIALDGNDPQFIALDFQLGRYLMIAGSRPGSQALNLQGKWNDSTAPSWDGKMTLNINEEMNYWGAEVCNLSECTLPLFDMIQDLSVTGGKIATSNYFSQGWVAHHNTDLWRDAAPCNGNDGIWPTGGAWLCQHVWWHYLYTGDTNWLATTGYPLMKGAAQFFQGFLVPHPTYGWMVTCPSYSPEHDEGTYNAGNVAGPTMDNELCRDLFQHASSPPARFWEWMPLSAPTSPRSWPNCRPNGSVQAASFKNGWKMWMAAVMTRSTGIVRISLDFFPGTKSPRFTPRIPLRPPMYPSGCAAMATAV